jgi:hypothetical protein
MTKIDVFDPPMCCSSGVCGPQVDPLLAAFAADVDWLGAQGVTVTRHNLAQEPFLTEVREQLAHRVAWVPWYPEPPVGRTHLLEFVRGGTVQALAPMAS